MRATIAWLTAMGFACSGGPPPDPGNGTAVTGAQDGGPPSVRLAFQQFNPYSVELLYPGQTCPDDSVPTIGVEASDGQGLKKVTLYLDQKVVGEIQAEGNGLFTFEVPPGKNPAGTHSVTHWLRAVAMNQQGLQAEDRLPWRALTPTTYGEDVESPIRLVTESPDAWETVGQTVRVRARLFHDHPRSPFEFIETASIAVFLDNQVLAEDEGTDLDQVFEIPQVAPGIRSLRVIAEAVVSDEGVHGPMTSNWKLEARIPLWVDPAVTTGSDPCAVVLDGIQDGTILERETLVWVRISPEDPSAEIQFELDGVLLFPPGLAPFYLLFPPGDLGDGRHTLRVSAMLSDGRSCADAVQFLWDTAVPEVLAGSVEPIESCRARITFRARDATPIRLDGCWGRRSEWATDGAIQYSCELSNHEPEATLYLTDLTGKTAAWTLALPEPLPDPWAPAMKLSIPPAIPSLYSNLVWGEWVLNATHHLCRRPTFVSAQITVDGIPGEDAGLQMLAPQDGAFWWDGKVLVRWLWDTRAVPDGPHQLRAELVLDGSIESADMQVIVTNQATTGRELVLSVCDPEFTVCGPIRTDGVRSPVGIEASLPWFASEGVPLTIRIEANQQEMATCTQPVCRWILDFDALGADQVHVVATADFSNLGLPLQVSADLARREVDLDQDGFASVGDGGDDCDDQDAFSHPGVPEPLFPVCASPGEPDVVPLDPIPGQVTLFSAIRTPGDVLNILFCDPITHSIQIARVFGTTVTTEPLDFGVPDCSTVRVQAVQDAGGTLFALLAEPGTDPMFLLARIEADSIEVQGLPIRDVTTNPALVLDSQGRPLILQSEAFRCNLLAWNNHGGVWEAIPLKAYPPFNWDRSVAAVRGRTPGAAVTRICKGGFELWTFGETIESTPLEVSFDGLTPTQLHLDRCPKFLAENVVVPFELVGATLGPSGEVFVLDRRGSDGSLPFLVATLGAATRFFSLVTDLIGPDGVPTWTLDRQEGFDIGTTSHAEVVVAWTREPFLNQWTLSSEWGHQFRSRTVVARVHRGDLVQLAGTERIEGDRVAVVQEALGAAEVVIGGAADGPTVWISWPCTQWEGWDPDCNGESGGEL